MEEMNQKFCQCCGMPMGDTDELYGTNADGSRNAEYCRYCFEKGEFTFQGTMEEMIELCVPNMAAANPDMTEEEARKIMLEWFPALKRWKDEKGDHNSMKVLDRACGNRAAFSSMVI